MRQGETDIHRRIVRLSQPVNPREGGGVLECVINISEGRDASVFAALTAAAGPSFLDRHSDPHHHRSVFTLGGPGVEVHARTLVADALARIDIRTHVGVHPRLGVADVVPFVPLAGSTLDDAVRARDAFAHWAADNLGVPCFLYGPLADGSARSLPEIRREAFRSLTPDCGPPSAHITAGASAVGARGVLVAFNVWLAPDATLDQAKQVARQVRSPTLRTLGLDVGGTAQVSCNLVDPVGTGPADAFDQVAAYAARTGTQAVGAELVGLLPAAVLEVVDPARWHALDLDPSRTIEARLEQAGLDGGSIRTEPRQ